MPWTATEVVLAVFRVKCDCGEVHFNPSPVPRIRVLDHNNTSQLLAPVVALLPLKDCTMLDRKIEYYDDDCRVCLSCFKEQEAPPATRVNIIYEPRTLRFTIPDSFPQDPRYGSKEPKPKLDDLLKDLNL